MVLLLPLLNGAVDAGAGPVALASPSAIPDLIHAIPPGAPVGVWVAAAVLALAFAVTLTSHYWGPALKQRLDNRRVELELRRAEIATKAAALTSPAPTPTDADAIGRAVQEQVLGLLDARLAPLTEQLERLAEAANQVSQVHEAIYGDGRQLGDRGVAVKIDAMWRDRGLDNAEPTSPGRTTVPPGGSRRRPG